MLRFKSRYLLEELKRRKREFSSPIKARLRVPPDLRWWYYQEMGVPHAYPIRAINAELLVFPFNKIPTGVAEVPKVNHPPLKPRRIITKILDPIGHMASRQLVRAMLQSGYRAEQVKAALVDTVMPQVKQMIVDSMERELPGRRPEQTISGVQVSAGRLGGKSAAEVFEEQAFVAAE